MPPTQSSFHAQYHALVASGAIEADPAQADAAEAFAALEERLSSYKPVRKLSLLGRLFGDKSEPPPRGLYVHGEVGRGKTMSTNSWPRCMSGSTAIARTSRAARSPTATSSR
jgi:predicted ATPase